MNLRALVNQLYFNCEKIEYLFEIYDTVPKSVSEIEE